MGAGDEGGEDVMAMAGSAADELYTLRDSFFPADILEKDSKLKSLADSALQILDAVPEAKRTSPLQRASFEYLRGKILDVFPVYRKEAEDHLSKAVKLNPSLSDAWLCLGNCIWKKGDLASARNCFSLGLSKAPNKKILCQLSMLERKLAQGNGHTLQLKTFDSISKILRTKLKVWKKAFGLPKERSPWMLRMEILGVNCLGNACLTSFFVNGVPDYNRLFQSIKAYQNAANKYLQNYQRALTGFEAAALKDPGLNAFEEVRKIVNVLDKIEDAMKVQFRKKNKDPPSSLFAEVSKSSSQGRATIKTLAEGQNKSVALTGRVLHFLKHDDAPPLYYIVCDSEQNCFVLSIYGLHSNALKEGDWVTLLEPYHQSVDFSWKNKHYGFSSIRVDFMGQLLVNGKAPSAHLAVQSMIQAQHKPS
ncbi:uncharacterized protein LOC144709330 isoform X3 [Wolffia australiana]